jgi:hypothetical protein
VEEANEVRYLLLLVPAFIDSCNCFFVSAKRPKLERVESRFLATKRGLNFPSEKQREAIKTKKLK